LGEEGNLICSVVKEENLIFPVAEEENLICSVAEEGFGPNQHLILTSQLSVFVILRGNFNTFWDFYNGASVCAGSLKGHMKGCACGRLLFLMDFFFLK